MALASRSARLLSEGFAKHPGGDLKWQCSREFISSDKAALKLHTLPVFITFLEKQDDAMSLFIEGLLGMVSVENFINVADKDHNNKMSDGKGNEATKGGVLAKGPEETPDSPTKSPQENIRRASAPSNSDGRLCIESIKDMQFTLDLQSKKEVMHTYSSQCKNPSARHAFYDLEVWADWWMNLKEPNRTSCFARVLRSMPFQFLTVAIILLNTIFIAVGANYEMETLSGTPQDWLSLAEKIFLSFYLLEISLKLSVHRVFFFVNDDMYWNMFDLLIVVFSSLDMFVSSSAVANMGFLRSLRILRVSKAFRLFRVITFLRDLRVMLSCILGSFMALFWCMVLLLLIGCICAIFYVQALAAYLREATDIPIILQQNIYSQFGSVNRALLTLFRMTNGLMDGSEVFETIEPTGSLNLALLLVIVGVYEISVINIVSGIFMEKALYHAKPEREQEVVDLRRDLMDRIAGLKELCKRLPLSEPGVVKRQEFLNALKDPDVMLAFETENLDIRDAQGFFDLLESVTGQDYIDIDTFITSCMRLRGYATSIDLHELDMRMRHQFGDVTKQIKSVPTGSFSDAFKESDSHISFSHIKNLQAAIARLEEGLAPLTSSMSLPQSSQDRRMIGRSGDLYQWV